MNEKAGQIMMRGLWMVEAWLMIGSSWLGLHPTPAHALVSVKGNRPLQAYPHPARPGVKGSDQSMHRFTGFPRKIPMSNPEVIQYGQNVLNQVLKGKAFTGVVVGQAGSHLFVHELNHRRGSFDVFDLTANTVVWKGGWALVGSTPQSAIPHESVNVVLRKHTVSGILSYRDGYGRVVKKDGRWVAIQPVKVFGNANPACAPSRGKPIVAESISKTVWNTRRGALPAGSLVQYTVYGEAGYPLILGGIEDYGRAHCARPAFPRPVPKSIHTNSTS